MRLVTADNEYIYIKEFVRVNAIVFGLVDDKSCGSKNVFISFHAGRFYTLFSRRRGYHRPGRLCCTSITCPKRNITSLV